MPWVRIDEHALGHVKIGALSHGAFRLWVEGLTYCQRYLTDGAISSKALRGFKYSNKARICELVSGFDGRAPLWVTTDDGFMVHDYLQWNEPRDRVLEKRESAKARMARLRGGNEAQTIGQTISKRNEIAEHLSSGESTKQSVNTRETVSRSREQTGERTPNVPDSTPHHTTNTDRREPKIARDRAGKSWEFPSLYVSQKQHAIVMNSIVENANRVDWDTFYSKAASYYAENGKPFDLLKDLKQRASYEVEAINDRAQRAQEEVKRRADDEKGLFEYERRAKLSPEESAAERDWRRRAIYNQLTPEEIAAIPIDAAKRERDFATWQAKRATMTTEQRAASIEAMHREKYARSAEEATRIKAERKEKERRRLDANGVSLV